MYKNNSRNRSKIRDCSPLQLYSNLLGKYHAIGSYSYTNRVRREKRGDFVNLFISREPWDS